MVSQVNSVKLLEKITPIILKLPTISQRMEHSQAHGKRPTTPWYQNQTKTAQDKENYRSVSLMNIDKKNPQQNTSNQNPTTH